jgi:hypothetical protein
LAKTLAYCEQFDILYIVKYPKPQFSFIAIAQRGKDPGAVIPKKFGVAASGFLILATGGQLWNLIRS